MAYISPELHQISTAVYGRDMRKAIHDSIEKVNNDVETKEPKINQGTISQYWCGDKTWSDFNTSVRNSALSGLSTSANLAISASDNVLTAFGKLQAQTNARLKLSGGTMSGNINMGSCKITSSFVPSTDNDYVNKKYTDSQDALKENIANKGIANGYASLDNNGKVPKSQISLTKADIGLGQADDTPDSSKKVLSASKLTTARKINGVSFDGSADITIHDTTKEPKINQGTISQYWRGDKTWTDFSTSVRNSALSGLSTSANLAISASDNVLTAFGKLQAQLNSKILSDADINGRIDDEIAARKNADDELSKRLSNINCEGLQSEFISLARQLAEIYALLGITLYNGGIFGDDYDDNSLDGGSFIIEPEQSFDCGDFKTTLNTAVIDGGKY